MVLVGLAASQEGHRCDVLVTLAAPEEGHRRDILVTLVASQEGRRRDVLVTLAVLQERYRRDPRAVWQCRDFNPSGAEKSRSIQFSPAPDTVSPPSFPLSRPSSPHTPRRSGWMKTRSCLCAGYCPTKLDWVTYLRLPIVRAHNSKLRAAS